MNKIVAAIAALLISTAAFAQSELPDTQIKDLNTGKKLAFNQAVTPGRVTLVSFWDVTCIPCKREMIAITKKMPEWVKESDFDYMLVSTDGSRTESMARNYIKEKGWTLPSYIDLNQDMRRSLNFQNNPFTIIIDKKGNIAYKHTGYEQGGEEDLWVKIKELNAQ
jgi:cytochrome c biogenesis protein CcmG/thiol:disulfide interchange protein DsbE